MYKTFLGRKYNIGNTNLINKKFPLLKRYSCNNMFNEHTKQNVDNLSHYQSGNFDSKIDEPKFEKVNAQINKIPSSARNIKSGEIYQHYKNNLLYEIIDFCIHTETLEIMVIYKALYCDQKYGNQCLWTRPKKMFLEDVEHLNVIVPRFKKILCCES